MLYCHNRDTVARFSNLYIKGYFRLLIIIQPLTSVVESENCITISRPPGGLESEVKMSAVRGRSVDYILFAGGGGSVSGSSWQSKSIYYSNKYPLLKCSRPGGKDVSSYLC